MQSPAVVAERSLTKVAVVWGERIAARTFDTRSGLLNRCAPLGYQRTVRAVKRSTLGKRFWRDTPSNSESIIALSFRNLAANNDRCV